MAGLTYTLVPDGIDDPAHPSGGNTYDRRVIGGLGELGWAVCERAVPGRWPRPARDDLDGLGRVLASIPDGSTALIDGLVASAAAGVLVPASARLALAVLVHMPLGVDESGAADGERAVLRRAAGVITTSAWTRDRLVQRYGLDPRRVNVAEPGVDPADRAPGSATGGRLLCVGVLAPHKGQDVLVQALDRVPDLAWSCSLAGALDVEPAFADRVRAAAGRLAGRVRFAGPLVGDELAAAYAATDLLVLPSRAETYGMVVGEALARAIPVVASDVGGVPCTLGRDPSGAAPGRLVDPGDAPALSSALRDWLADPDLRGRWRAAAARRRTTLTGWSTTARRVGDALAGVTR